MVRTLSQLNKDNFGSIEFSRTNIKTIRFFSYTYFFLQLYFTTRFSQPDSMNNIIFETNVPISMLYPYKNNAITNTNQHEQQPIIQSTDVTNHFDSGKIRFNESSSYLCTTGDTSPDGEREEEELEGKDEDDEGDDDDNNGVLIGSHSLASSNIVVNSSPLSLVIGLSSQSSPITSTSLSSNIENSTTTINHNSNFIGTERSDDRNGEIILSGSHEKQDSTNVMISMLSNSGSSSTLTLTSHGSSNDCHNNNNNPNQTLTNGRTSTIKSLRDYAFQRQSSQSPIRSTEIVNQRFSNSSSFPPQIRMATLDKLIERLTYPTYFDTRLVNCFLLVYRRVTTSDELLDLLIERFRIPDPEFLPEEWNIEVEQGQLESPAQHMLKRFRSGYKKRIQSR